MQTSQIAVQNYGNYSSNNYGSSRMVRIGELDFYFSYETVIAFRSPATGLRVRVNDWSTTTGKHLNAIDGGDKKTRIQGEQFEKELAELLAKYQLVKAEN